MKLQIFKFLKGRGTTTNKEIKNFNYLHKIDEIECEEINGSTVRAVSDTLYNNNLSPEEVMFHKEPDDRTPYENQNQTK